MTTEIKTICFIGAGNVATHMALALYQAGYNVNGIFSRHIEHAQVLACKVHGVAVDRLIQLPKADVYIFTLKDSVLGKVAQEFASVTRNPDALYVHTAGSMPLTVLTDIYRRTAVLYPLQSFNKERPLTFREIPVFVEAGTSEALSAIMGIADRVSDKVSVLDSAKRKKLHLSAVFACNFVNHCYNLAFNLLEKENIDPSNLYGLIDETSRKIHTMSPHAAQTGPAVRWDENVMRSQMEQLRDFPEMQSVYRVMSESIHKEFSL